MVVYVGAVDLYSRKVVGWAMSDPLETPWVSDALAMALGRRQPDAGLIHHSDRGSQYACHAYRGCVGPWYCGQQEWQGGLLRLQSQSGFLAA